MTDRNISRQITYTIPIEWGFTGGHDGRYQTLTEALVTLVLNNGAVDSVRTNSPFDLRYNFPESLSVTMTDSGDEDINKQDLADVLNIIDTVVALIMAR